MGSFSRVQIARLAGLLYLIVAVTGGFSELVVRSGVKVAGDATATAENIRASAPLFRLGFVTDLIDITMFVLLGFVLYVLLSPVNRRVAATFVVFNAIAAAVMSANMINHVGALLVATDPIFTATLGAPSANGLALFFIDLHHQGYLIAQIFFGGWLLPLGYVVYKSGFFPRALGVLLMIGCASYVVEMGATYLSPQFDSAGVVLLAMPAAIAELAFTVWLLVKGARPEADTEFTTAQISGRAATA